MARNPRRRVATVIDDQFEVADFNLNRFVTAQAGGLHERALAEVLAGRKLTHWMWFVYPQLRGLGRSETSIHYGIASLEEARAFLHHPVLGPGLLAATGAAVEAPASLSAEDVFGPIDAKKLQSSMTLFAHAAADSLPFERVLTRWFDGRHDPHTEALLAKHP